LKRALPCQIDDATVERYRADGFAVLPRLLTEAQVASWRKEVAAAVRARAATPPSGRLGSLDGNPGPNELFLQHVNLWQTHLGMRQLVLDSALGMVAARLAGIDAVRVCFDSLLIKLPFSPASRFHLDLPHWSIDDARAATLWIALDEVDLSNGCMCYLAGTHHARGGDLTNAPHGFRTLFTLNPGWAAIEPVFCPLRAGDAIVHSALTAHGSTANMRPASRWAMTIAFMPDGSVFNGMRSPLFSVPDGAVAGLVLNDPEEHPRTFGDARRSTSAPNSVDHNRV
jgi:phytanoyl-CoA hydroxylase